ncbi:DNA recombination protein RmuC [Neisseria leonii]|uniref:DNA recombination protein RmuC n=1 Tax=Neisseria leonii TaxID=2995413 RepID=A0A9X4IBQ1_9NEIS|nr:DNA recombination protein RmuC [Neisseria sp. 51.81]MDD9328629.1 DNA recombination protein RmuC [Neisseria sp. 51.81]
MNTDITLLTYLLPAAAALLAGLIMWLVMRSRAQQAARTQAAAYQSREAESAQRLAVAQDRLLHTETLYQEGETALQQIRAEHTALHHRLTEAETLCRRLPELEAQLAESLAYTQHWQEQAQQHARELSGQAEHVRHLETQTAETGRLKAALTELQQQLADSRLQYARLKTQAEQEQAAHEEKLALLNDARNQLGAQFQHLANAIFEEKSRRITEQNHEYLGRLLTPLNERIHGFSQLVQQTYEKETKERLTLENELKRLQLLNSQLHHDAKALTQALLGTQNKSQGSWGEMILESVLEHSGLQKGREYITQAVGSRTEEDGSIRRLQPDVLINLPDGKQIIIDAKVSLTAYVRHTEAADTETAARELAAHIQSVRSHVKTLSQKQYSDIEGLHTLDFVFMFIPIEPAYLSALQHDGSLFQECFDKRIMLVGPSTLLATLRTVVNLWRNEQQNLNAQKIAEEGGKLYDKFVGFVQTLEKVGKNLSQAQSEYQNAYNQLSGGRGNLITRAEKLHRLGIKAGKRLDKTLTEAAAHTADRLPLPVGQSDSETGH